MRKAAPHLEFRSQPKSGAVHQGIPEIFGAFFLGGATDQENVSKVRIEQTKKNSSRFRGCQEMPVNMRS